MGKNIYVHIPFCERKCPYCDFYSITDRTSSSAYVDALIKEARAFAESGVVFEPNGSDDTLYIGGGTPSSIDAGDIARLVETLRELYSLSSDAEITIEVNPSSLTAGKAAIYKDSGINRVSMGVQSLDDDVLKTLGRLHDSEGARRAIGILQDVFDNISCDLMSGIPGQTMGSLLSGAEELLSRGIKHVSCYSLSLEEGTVFEKKYIDNIEESVPPETEREMYHKVREVLRQGGLLPYEISNSAVPGFESRHLTPGRIKEYFDNRTFQSDLIVTTDIMTEEEKMKEYPFLALRTNAGMNTSRFKDMFGKDIHDVFGDAIARNMERGLLVQDGDRIFLTEKGFDLADMVIRDMI